MSWRKKAIGAICISIVTLSIPFILAYSLQHDTGPTAAQHKVGTSPPVTVPEEDKNEFDKSTHSLTDPNSLWIIANKTHQLTPVRYVPKDLTTPRVAGTTDKAKFKMRREAAESLEHLFESAAKQGVMLRLSSAYRSYEHQESIYARYVSRDGVAITDTYSARPGFSEHQTGLAADIHGLDNKCAFDACFGATPEGKWLELNAHLYGFLLRYPRGKEPVTGYRYEPWHFRYIGTHLAQEMHRRNIQTLEEFFSVGGGQIYY